MVQKVVLVALLCLLGAVLFNYTLVEQTTVEGTCGDFTCVCEVNEVLQNPNTICTSYCDNLHPAERAQTKPNLGAAWLSMTLGQSFARDSMSRVTYDSARPYLEHMLIVAECNGFPLRKDLLRNFNEYGSWRTILVVTLAP